MARPATFAAAFLLLLSVLPAHGGKLHECLRSALSVFDDERSSNPVESWTIDGIDGSKSYNKDFSKLYKISGEHDATDYLQRFLKARKNEGKTTHVLDLFGSGFFVEDRNIADSVTGLRFYSYDKSKLPADFNGLNIPKEVLGDVLQKETWQKLDQSMLDRSIPKMDLVTMRPVGGWYQSKFSKTAEGNIKALSFIIKNTSTRLNDSGRFYFSVMSRQISRELLDHSSLLKLQKEIEETTPFHLTLQYGIAVLKNEKEPIGKISGALLPKK